MNNNSYNNAEQILKNVLNSEAGRRAINNINNASEGEIINKIAKMNKAEIAAKLNALGISQSYISRLEKRILHRLKTEMEKAG